MAKVTINDEIPTLLLRKAYDHQPLQQDAYYYQDTMKAPPYKIKVDPQANQMI